MRICAPVILLACFLAAGCWQSEGSLFGGAKPVQPLAAGKVASKDPGMPKKLHHFLLTKESGGAYRLANSDKASSDFGDAVRLRFFALSDLPKDTFVFEAVSDDKCKPGNVCTPVTAKSERDYGLVRLTRRGAEVTSPACDKASAAAKLPGVTADDYGTCTFTSRASLETALKAQARQGWKASLAYNYE
jgi:hypothetical protein